MGRLDALLQEAGDEVANARRRNTAEQIAFTARQVRQLLVIAVAACVIAAAFYAGTLAAPDPIAPATYPATADPPATLIAKPYGPAAANPYGGEVGDEEATGAAEARVLVPVLPAEVWPPLPSGFRNADTFRADAQQPATHDDDDNASDRGRD